MQGDVSESDWDWFRQIRGVALQRFCDRILAETQGIMADAAHSSHERYIAIHNLMQERNSEIAVGFDAPRRSSVVTQLLFMRRRELLTDDEFFLFTRELCELITKMVSDVDERR